MNLDLSQVVREQDFEILCVNPHSRYIKTENYQIMIMKFLTLSQDNFEDNFLKFFFQDDKFYHVNQHNSAELLDDPKVIFEMLWKKFEYLEQYLNEQTQQIEILEDKLYERRVPRHFMDIWFYFKKDISKLDRTITRNSQVCVESKNSKFFNTDLGAPEGARIELLDYLSLLSRNAQHLIQKLDSLHHYYNSIKGDRMNHSLYLLALVSGIFLPLNLIVGFFGMNTNNLFLANHPKGTQVVFYSIIIVFFTLMLGLPLLKFIDQWILRRFLGRYKFYSGLSKRLENISDKFSV